MRQRLWPSLVVLALILVAAAVVVTAALRRDGTAGQPAAQTAGADHSAGAAVGDKRANPAPVDDRGEVVTTTLFRNIAQRQNPVVVAITTESRVQPTDFTQSGPDDFFRRFFGGGPQSREQLRRALGSGFLIQPTGEILTNNHVVAGADEIRVVLFTNQQTKYAADVVGRDPLTDSALIKLKNPPSNLPVASLGNSEALEPGDWVMAIGNPFELGHTVTVGVISYKGRPFATTEGRFQNMLQTDASINPGNSGGPLIDVHGQVIGINTAILGSQSGGNVGIGFAVPINTVKDLLPQLRKGAVHRGRLGVQILSAPVTQDEASQLGLPSAQGAIVSRVEPDSPADRAGLQAGDVIVEYNGKAVENANQLTSMVVNTQAGTKVSIAFFRNGKRQQGTATIDELQLEDENGGGSERGAAPGFGVSLGDITPDVARQLRLAPGTSGAVVESVEPFAPASNAGIQPGDVILEVNRQPVRSAREAADALRQVQAGKPAFLLLSRHGAQQFVEVRKE